MKRKNLLLLINDLHAGGAQRVVSKLSSELEEDYNILLVTYNHTEAMFTHGGKHIFIELPFSKSPSENGTIKRLLRFLLLIKQLRKIKKKHSIDISLSFLEASNFVNIISRKGERILVSVRSHLSSEFKDDRRLYAFRYLIKLLYNKADLIVVPSDLAKSDLQSNFSVRGEKIAVIYNFIDLASIRRAMSGEILTDAERHLFSYPVLLNAGRMTYAKGQWLLVEVFAELKLKVPNLKLVVIGSGPLQSKILQAAESNNLKVIQGSEKVLNMSDIDVCDIALLGFKENPYPYYGASSVFVLSSLYEGFPNVVIEAMASGLPIVSADCPSGPREILAPQSGSDYQTSSAEFTEYGVLMPPFTKEIADKEQVQTWVDGILELLSDEAKQAHYANQSKARAADFDKIIVLTKWRTAIEGAPMIGLS